MNEPAGDVYGGGNGASGVTNVGSTVESGRPRGWSYATALGGIPRETRRGGARQRYECLQDLLRLNKDGART